MTRENIQFKQTLNRVEKDREESKRKMDDLLQEFRKVQEKQVLASQGREEVEISFPFFVFSIFCCLLAASPFFPSLPLKNRPKRSWRK